MYSCNKIIGDLKNGEIRIFFVFLEQIRVVLRVFRGTCIVGNFFIVSLCARNCTPAIKLLHVKLLHAIPLSVKEQVSALVRASDAEFTSLRLRRTRTLSVFVNDKKDDSCELRGEQLKSVLYVSIVFYKYMFLF